MPKLPDFSKFDLQGLVNSVKSILSPEAGTPRVAEGDTIGSKMVEISTLLQNATKNQEQAAKDLNQVNILINALYKDLEAVRKLEAELRQKQQAEQAAQTTVPPGTAKTTGQSVPPAGAPATGAREEPSFNTGATTTSESVGKTPPPTDINLKAEKEALKKKDTSLDPAEGTATPSDHD